MKFKVTVVFEYEVDPSSYDTDDLLEMCALDKKTFESTEEGAALLSELLFDDENLQVSVVPSTVIDKW